MPLKLIPPRAGKSPNFSIRGTHRGVYIDKTSGTDRRQDAAKRLAEIKNAIEGGAYQAKPLEARDTRLTFAVAALRYLETGHSPRYVPPLLKYFGDTPVEDINQEAIDECAATLRPNVTMATRNTCVYTPLSAILKHAGIKTGIRRPKGAKGREVNNALHPEDASAIIRAAEAFDQEYALLLRFLLYTGVRLGEALRLEWEDVRFAERSALIRLTKNGDPRTLRLRDDLCELLEGHRWSTNKSKVFRFRQGGWLKLRLLRAKLAALGIAMPPRPKKPGEKHRTPPHRLSWVNHHTFRHTWATWMRRFGGADIPGLLQTKNWRDERSVRRYVHVVAAEEWDRVDKLPGIGGKAVELTSEAKKAK